MADLPPLQLDTSAYLSDTGQLSTIEHGAYLLILMAMWRSRDGWLDGSDRYLARVTRLTLGRWKKIAPTVRALLISREGRVAQKRTLRDKKSILGENQNSSAKSLKYIGPDSETPPKPKIDPLSSFSLVGDSESKEQGSKKKTKGRILPNDWKPRPLERVYGKTVLRLSDAQVDAAAEKMRRWAISNQHRAIARKSDWDMTFRNWMDNEAERRAAHPYAPREAKSGNVFADIRRDLRNRFNEGDDDGPDAEGDDVKRSLPAIGAR